MPLCRVRAGGHQQFLLLMIKVGVTDAGHKMIVLFYLNAGVPEQNYQEKADAAAVTFS